VKYSESGDFVNTPQNNSIQREINSLEIQIKALEAELKRRSE
jgi:hypothetical protein